MRVRLTLFEISTTEGWVDVMYSAADSVQPYVAWRQPIEQRVSGACVVR